MANSSITSVGIVTPEVFHFKDPLILRSGKIIPYYDLITESYGELNKKKDNAILICHALSGDHHAAGFHSESEKKPGWWDSAIGPGKAIDTNLFYVVSVNNLGGCGGSTGPTSVNSVTGKPFGPDFPVITVADWVESQKRLMEVLNIEKWAAVIGGSLGGMQAQHWAIEYPEKLRGAICIASAAKLSAQNIAFNEVARHSITKDPNFHEGRYLEHNSNPKQGLMLARMIGHITYLSDSAMRLKFGKEVTGDQLKPEKNVGRNLKSGELSYELNVDFEVESYLHYQGERFSNNFDANTYLLKTKILDYFDPAEKFNGNLSMAFQEIEAQVMVISFSTDWRFSPDRSKEIVNALIEAKKNVSYLEIESPHGHDSFLLADKDYVNGLSSFLEN